MRCTWPPVIFTAAEPWQLRTLACARLANNWRLGCSLQRRNPLKETALCTSTFSFSLLPFDFLGCGSLDLQAEEAPAVGSGGNGEIEISVGVEVVGSHVQPVGGGQRRVG